MRWMPDDLANEHRQPVLPEGSAGPETGSLGTVIAIGDGLFQVRLQNGQCVLAHLGGRLRLCPARLNVGDVVMIQIASFDPSRGRIVRRLGHGEIT